MHINKQITQDKQQQPYKTGAPSTKQNKNAAEEDNS